MNAAHTTALVLLLAASCGTQDRSNTNEPDPSSPDAGAVDAGPSAVDGGTVEQPEEDGGAPDVVDAGPTEVVDAGSPEVVDAGAPEVVDAGSSAAQDAGPAPSPKLQVSVTGARNATGRTCLALFDEASAFPNDAGRAVFNQCFTNVAGPFVIEGLVDGRTYGISLFHDANANSALDTQNLFGLEVPSEGIGFSRDPALGVGPPSWDAVKFTFDAAHRTLSIRLTYLL